MRGATGVGIGWPRLGVNHLVDCRGESTMGGVRGAVEQLWLYGSDVAASGQRKLKDRRQQRGHTARALSQYITLQ
jgi:hypothetical protein